MPRWRGELGHRKLSHHRQRAGRRRKWGQGASRLACRPRGAGVVGGEVAGRILGGGGLRGRVGARVVTQDTDQPAGVSQGRSPGVTQDCQGLLGHLRVAVHRGGGAVGHRDHDGEGVGDDVVHLAGDAAALVGCGQHHRLLTSQGQSRRSLADLDELGVLNAQDDAHQCPDDVNERQRQQAGADRAAGQDRHGAGRPGPAHAVAGGQGHQAQRCAKHDDGGQGLARRGGVSALEVKDCQAGDQMRRRRKGDHCPGQDR